MTITIKHKDGAVSQINLDTDTITSEELGDIVYVANFIKVR